jgi:hypothetical protein
MAMRLVDNATPKNRALLGYEPGKSFFEMTWKPSAPGSAEGVWVDGEGETVTPAYWDDLPKVPLNKWTHEAMVLADAYAKASPTTAAAARLALYRHVLKAGRE